MLSLVLLTLWANYVSWPAGRILTDVKKERSELELG